MLKKLQRGFTLIELVIVIIVLGILAAFLLPRFGSLDARARVATVNALGGSVQAAMNIAHAQCVAEVQANGSTTVAGQCSGSLASGTTTMDGVAVTIVNGYPSSAAGGIEAALSSYSGFTLVSGTGGVTPATFSRPDATGTGGSGACKVVYTPGANAQTAPTVVTTVTGC